MARAALQKARETSGSTKARILEAAEAVFALRGFAGASTREIAAHAHVNISSLHYHWESKETLYVAVFREVYRQIERRLESAIAPYLADHRPKADVLAVTIDELFAFFDERPTLPRLLFRGIVDEDHGDLGVDRDVLAPTWTGSLGLLSVQSRPMRDIDARLFVLTMHVVQLAYMLDGRAFRTFLGSSVREEPLRSQVREHLVALMRHFLSA